MPKADEQLITVDIDTCTANPVQQTIVPYDCKNETGEDYQTATGMKSYLRVKIMKDGPYKEIEYGEVLWKQNAGRELLKLPELYFFQTFSDLFVFEPLPEKNEAETNEESTKWIKAKL